MKPRHIVIIALFVIINVVILFVLFSGGEPREGLEETTEDFIVHLEAMQVKNSKATFNVSGYGTVSSYNALDVSSEVQGKMRSGVKLKPGVHFRKGQLLFKINNDDARYSLRSRKSSFITLIANILPDIKVDFSSEFKKWDDYIESIHLDEPLPTLPAWKTNKEKIFLSTRNVLTEYFAIKSQEEQLLKYYVHAPFSGLITDVYINEHAVVNPGTRIIRIVETGNYEIAASIPTSHVDKVKIGTEVRIYTTEGRQKGVGKVVRMSEVINRNTQSVDVYIKPEANEGERFIEGEYVQVSIDKTGEFNGVRIPLEAINEGKVWLYARNDSTLYSKSISVLDENDNGAFVSGLNDQDIVIIQEVLNYTDTTKYGVLIR